MNQPLNFRGANPTRSPFGMNPLWDEPHNFNKCFDLNSPLLMEQVVWFKRSINIVFSQKSGKVKGAYQKIVKLDSRHGKNQLLPQSHLKKLFPGGLAELSVSNHDMKKLVVSLHIPLKIDCCKKKSVCLGSIFGPKASPLKKRGGLVFANI